MVADDLPVLGERHRAHGVCHRVPEPAIQPLPDGEVARVEGKTSRGVITRLGKGCFDLLVLLTIDGLALRVGVSFGTSRSSFISNGNLIEF